VFSRQNIVVGGRPTINYLEVRLYTSLDDDDDDDDDDEQMIVINEQDSLGFS